MRARFGTKILFKLWNPFKLTDNSGNCIKDIMIKRRSKRLSVKIKEERKTFNEPERKTHKCAILKKMDFSGD